MGRHEGSEAGVKDGEKALFLQGFPEIFRFFEAEEI